MLKRGENILGLSCSSESNRTFSSYSPSDGRCSGWEFYCASEVEVRKACELGITAYRQLQHTSHEHRAIFIRKIAHNIEENSTSILEMYVLESGLSWYRGQQELSRTLKQLHDFSDLVHQNEWIEASIDVGDLSLDPPLNDVRKMRIGIGPVVVFGASNFPLAYSTAGGDTASAFAAGCPVIVKAHPLHPATSQLVAVCISDAAVETNMPDGVFSHLFDDGFDVGRSLVMNQHVKAVGFTGSLSGGRALFDLANSRANPIPVFAEMGSINPIFLLDIIPNQISHWSKRIAASITSDSGQFCTKPGLLFVLDGATTVEFVRQLRTEISATIAGTMLSRAIQENMQTKVNCLTEKYATITRGIAREPFMNDGVPVLLELPVKEFLENNQLQEEIFAPSAILVHCHTNQELVTCANRLSGQLTATIIGENDLFSELCSALREKAGRIIANGVPTGVRVCPSMNHGGPYPASTDASSTAVGIDAVKRFSRFVTYQNFPEEHLPEELRNENSLKRRRRVNGEWTIAAIE